ncbi:MAG: class I SAM-dependent methyltransferase [Litoreibacter sp.]|nr:class I SAM-dependent methyltransferase [Litoreibacter sp.]
MTDKQTIEVYDARAKQYLDLVSRTEPDADLHAFLDAMPAGGHALDLGCGPGNSAAMMRDAGLIVEAWDASAEMVAIAQKKFGLDAKQAVFNDLTSESSYDGIWANFSLLHAPKAEFPRHLAAIKTALKPGGVFHIGMKLGAEDHRDKIGRLYTYFTLDALKTHLQEAGFTPRRIREGSEAGLSGEVSPFAVILSHA